MPLPARLRNRGEEIALDVRPHWWALAGPLAAVIVILAAGLTALGDRAPAAADVVVLAVLVIAVAWLLARYLRWATTSLIVTSERLILRRGLIAKSGREIPLEQLSDIGYRQRIFQRLIGAGDLVLESAGRDSEEVFAGLPHPAAIQEEIYAQIDAVRARHADRMAGRRELSVPEQIDKLDELRRRGVITQAEFDAKKTQLLDRM